MKKFLFYFVLLMCVYELQSQSEPYPYNPDSLNLRHYEDRYYFPQIKQDGYLDNIPFLEVFCESNPNLPLYTTLDSNYYTALFDMRAAPQCVNVIADFAMPYSSINPISIAGISALMMNDAWTGRQIYDDTIGALSVYLQIRNNTLDSVLAFVEVPANSIDSWSTDMRSIHMLGDNVSYTEKFFDEPITVTGDFYTVLSTPDTSEFINNNPDIISNPYLAVLCSRTDIISNGRLPSPYWKHISSTQWVPVPSVSKFVMLYLFPILEEGTSGQQNIDIASLTHISPNPAGNYTDINCGYQIKEIKLYNSSGRQVSQYSPNAYNVHLNLSDYPAGLYIVKIVTEKGSTTKKLVHLEQ